MHTCICCNSYLCNANSLHYFNPTWSFSTEAYLPIASELANGQFMLFVLPSYFYVIIMLLVVLCLLAWL